MCGFFDRKPVWSRAPTVTWLMRTPSRTPSSASRGQQKCRYLPKLVAPRAKRRRSLPTGHRRVRRDVPSRQRLAAGRPRCRIARRRCRPGGGHPSRPDGRRSAHARPVFQILPGLQTANDARRRVRSRDRSAPGPTALASARPRARPITPRRSTSLHASGADPRPGRLRRWSRRWRPASGVARDRSRVRRRIAVPELLPVALPAQDPQRQAGRGRDDQVRDQHSDQEGHDVATDRRHGLA